MNAFHETTWNAFFPSSFRLFALGSALLPPFAFIYLGVPSNPGKSVYMQQLSTRRLAEVPTLFAEISAKRVTFLSHINSEPAKQYFNIYRS